MYKIDDAISLAMTDGKDFRHGAWAVKHILKASALTYSTKEESEVILVFKYIDSINFSLHGFTNAIMLRRVSAQLPGMICTMPEGLRFIHEDDRIYSIHATRDYYLINGDLYEWRPHDTRDKALSGWCLMRPLNWLE